MSGKWTPEPWILGSPNYRCVKPHGGARFHPGPGGKDGCEYTFQGWIGPDNGFDCYISSEAERKQIVGSDEGGPILDPADAERIVECVNACKDIPNPEAIPELIEALKDLITAVSPEPNGTMRRMADRNARLEWYLDMTPKRDRVSAALAKAGIK